MIDKGATLLFALIAIMLTVSSVWAFMISAMSSDTLGMCLAAATAVAALICGSMLREWMLKWLSSRSIRRQSDDAGRRIEMRATDSDFSEWEWEFRSKRTE